MKSPIFNDFIKVILDNQKEPQMVPIFLLQVCVIELYNSLVGDPNEFSLQEARDEENNIIISDYTLLTLLPMQF